MTFKTMQDFTENIINILPFRNNKNVQVLQKMFKTLKT